MLRSGVMLLLLLILGCSGGDPVVQQTRERFLVSQPPASEQPIPEFREGLADQSIAGTDVITVRARINAGDFPPFAEGFAAFMVTDATGHDGDESHNPHECPFCKRDINSVMARVEFQAEDGAPLRIGAQKLFDLQEMDLVVVSGRGRIDEDDSLVITAEKLYVHR